MEKTENNSKKKIIILIVTIAVLLIGALLAWYFSTQIRATTMRVLRIEGDVSLEDDGKSRTVTENLRLNSGNALSTAVQSLVAIGLDDTKIVTLDEKSRAEFTQKGRKLDLQLTAGSLFFEVKKPLEADENFEIKTNTMVVGIRGTSGWVSVDGEHESLIVTDGKVHVIGTNHVTGESKEIDVKAGQRISTYLYNDRTVDSIEFFLEEITEHDLPEFLLERLRENPELLDKVCKETGWDKPWILGIDVVTPTPTETPVPEEKTSTDEDEEELIAEEEPETEVPEENHTEEPANEEPDESELEKLLEQMLALITPTPSPTPFVEQPQPVVEEENHDDDDDEEESKPTATPAPTATPTPSPSPTQGPSAPSGSVSYTPQQGGSQSFDIKDGNNNILGQVELVFNNGAVTSMTPKSSGSYSVPLTASDSTNNNNSYKVNNLTDFNWNGATLYGSSNPLKIYNNNNGNYVEVTPGTPTDTYTLYDSSGNTITQQSGDYYFSQFMENAKQSGTTY